MTRSHQVCLIAILLPGWIACTGGDDTRLKTRGSISGQVVLSEIPGLNDQSRVSIDLGRGEGVLLPKEDGSFEASDLEPDIYEVRIVYSGGLTSDAVEHACAVREDGLLLCWGRGYTGASGNKSSVTRLEPLAVNFDTDWERVSA